MSEVREVEHIQLTLVDIKQDIRDIKSGTSDFDKLRILVKMNGDSGGT